MITGGMSMNEIDVYFLDDSELAEYEAISKGYRIDVYVKTVPTLGTSI
jgi:hypothetical protein